MKKKLYCILYIGVLVMFLAGCQDEALFTPDSDELVNVSYQVKVGDDLQSRAIGDGSLVDTLIVGVFQTVNEQLTQVRQYGFVVKDGKADINIPLLSSQSYDLVFWAQTKNNGLYDVTDLSQITVNYSNFVKTQAQGIALDAFYTTRRGVTVVEPGNKDISLVRPFTQMSFGVYGNQEQVENITRARITVNGGLYTGFMPLADGEKAVLGEGETYTFTFTEINDRKNTFIIDGMEYTHLTANYFFVPTSPGGEIQKISGSVQLMADEETIVSEFDFAEAPLLANTRVNIGKGLVEVWDGVVVEALPAPDEDGIIHIENTQQMAYLLQYGLKGTMKGTEEQPARVLLAKDLDMDLGVEPKLLKRHASYRVDSVSFDGGGHTLYGLNMALFRSATHIEVTNLTISHSDIRWEQNAEEGKTEGHVGALIDTLRSSAVFRGVAVKNSKVKTANGAAGGLVGYIARSEEKDRAEALAVTFDSCHVSYTVPEATLSEGYFVGLLSGYDHGESLTFTETCTLTLEEEEEESVETLAETEEPAPFGSRYVVANMPAWLKDTELKDYSGWLGNERYYRGIVRFGYVDEENTGTLFVLKWDGTTTVEPLLANPTYDSEVTAAANKFVVYSPFDLAGVRKKTASPAAIYLRADIDMNGQGADGEFNVPSNFTQSAYSSTDDNVFDPFSYVTTLDGMKSETENYSIYNLSISQIEQERAAFILYASGTTSHKNINFRNCQTVAVHKPVSTDAKAYGAILVSNVDATYTMENVHAYDCKVFALQKVGTLGARISGTSTLTNNSVNNCYVENYKCDITERFESGSKTMAGITIKNVYADFYPHGEVGGMYGFIQGTSALTNCSVNNSTVDAYGQDDKNATIQGSGFMGSLAAAGLYGLGYYLVPGRHVSTMIGNIRATGTVTLKGCTVDENTQCTNRWDKHNSTYSYIGQAYIVKFLDNEGSVTVDGNKLTLADCNRNTKL